MALTDGLSHPGQNGSFGPWSTVSVQSSPVPKTSLPPLSSCRRWSRWFPVWSLKTRGTKHQRRRSGAVPEVCQSHSTLWLPTCCERLLVRPDVTTLVTGNTEQRVTQMRNCTATSDRREGTKLWFNAMEKTGDKRSIGFLHNSTQQVVVTEIL